MCQLEIWVRFSPQLPFSCTSIISDRNIWRLPAVQFHFWIIFGYKLNTVYCSSQIYKKIKFKAGCEWNSGASKIFYTMTKHCKIFIYFKFHVHHDGGPGQRSYFEVFLSERGKLFVCKIWSSSDTPNRFFANKCHIFYKYPMGLFFPQYLYSCSPVRTGIIKFG